LVFSTCSQRQRQHHACIPWASLASARMDSTPSSHISVRSCICVARRVLVQRPIEPGSRTSALAAACPRHRAVASGLDAAMAASAGRRPDLAEDARSESGSGSAAGSFSPVPKKTRTKRPRIDLDESIEQARAAMQAAQKRVAEARRVARNERRKKQRLLKKAVSLSPDDLERIAVLKRCGLSHMQPDPGPHGQPLAREAAQTHPAARKMRTTQHDARAPLQLPTRSLSYR
jgi:hypothetical protein